MESLVVATDGISYVWDFGDGSPISNEANPIHTFMTAGTFPVSLRVVGAGGCDDIVTKETIEISGGPSALFSTDPDLEINGVVYLPNAEVMFLNQSENASSYLWDFGDGNYSSDKDPIHNYEQPGTYHVILTAKDDKGCVAVDSLGPFNVLSPDLRIPNIFTPNNDGFNDEFMVMYQGSEPYQVTVFDRWGRKYFETTNTGDFWSGKTFKGDDASEGVYYYTVQIGDKSYNGHVTLLR